MRVFGKKKAKSYLSVRYIDDDLVLSDTHAWTYVRVPTVRYEFLGYDDRKAIAERIYLALAALVTGVDPIEAHLVVTSRPFAVDTWREQLEAKVDSWGEAKPGWGPYLDALSDHLDDQEYHQKEVYLGICLGPRRTSLKSQGLDLLGPINRLAKSAESALDLNDFVVTDKEIDTFRTAAAEVRRSLRQSQIRATPATSDEVAWLVMNPQYPDMVTPAPTSVSSRVWGPGEIQALAESYIENHRRYLAITQVDWSTGEEITGYTATLALSRFPDTLTFPDQEPWMHFASALMHRVDISSRFTLVPATRVAKDVGRKLAEVKDQALHIGETGASIPLEIQEQYNRAVGLEYVISRDRQPWVYGRHRLRITASTPEELSARVKKTVEHYRDLGIDVVWPSGDQLGLLYEAMPGDKVRNNAYYQRQELHLIGGGMPTASAEVGDRPDEGKGWTGLAIGETTSRVRNLVHFALHNGPARNFPPGVAITGAPGGGKSFLAFTLAYQAALQGVWTIYIDPKADAKPMAELQGLGAAKVFDLRDGNAGMLDPFSLGDSVVESKLLALETIRLLLGTTMSEDRENALNRALERVAAEPNPSLTRVMEVLLASDDKAAENLGLALRNLSDLPFARLCFSHDTGVKMRPEDGLTVITLLGLKLPSAETDPSQYGYNERLAVAIMYLLSTYAQRLMLSRNKSHPKAIFIDEAWAITSTPQGAKLIPEIARMGRSHNTAIVLVSQNAGDLMKEAVLNSISTVFSFRSQNRNEIDHVLALLNAEAHVGHRSAVRELFDGECLMRDLDGRIARVQIDSWNRELFEAFNTNPETRKRREEEGS
jgi:hypothetical protein